MTPLAIVQDYLDWMGAAVMAGDYPTYRRGVAMPFNLVTDAATLTIETEDQLRSGFDTYCQMLQVNRVTDLVRIAERAEALSDLLITGCYDTNILSDAKRIVPQLRSQMTLRCGEDGWRAVSISSGIANPRWPIDRPRLRPAEETISDTPPAPAASKKDETR